MGLALILAGTIAMGVAGPRRIVRSCLTAWSGWTSEWRGGSSRDGSTEASARMDALDREIDRLREEVRPGATTPSPAAMQAEIAELKAEVARLQGLVTRHERGIQVVRETLNEMAECQHGGTGERSR